MRHGGPAIPERYVRFAREVAKLAVKHHLRSFDLNIHPGYEDCAEWNDMISIGWKQGRHGEERNDLYLSSIVQRISTVECSSEKEPASPPAQAAEPDAKVERCECKEPVLGERFAGHTHGRLCRECGKPAKGGSQ